MCKPNLPGTKENCIKILKATGIKGWQVGKTKVFLKYYHLDQIAEVLERMGKSAIAIQRFIRGFLDRKLVARKLEVARQQAEKIQGLLSQIQGLSIQLSNQQQAALKNDKNIPQSKLFFNYRVNPYPANYSKWKHGSSVVRHLPLVLEVPGLIPAGGKENFSVRTCFL